MTRRHVFALDLKDDPKIISAYRAWHEPGRTPPEIIQSIRASGIQSLDIHLTGNRLFMIMEVDDTFDAQAKASADAADPVVLGWEALMWRFQQPLPWSQPGEKWVAADPIFTLADHR